MQRSGNNGIKNIEKTVDDILKSKTRSRIYVYLLRKNGARTEQIIKGTKLHPSTVRETLSQMYSQKLILRKKIKSMLQVMFISMIQSLQSLPIVWSTSRIKDQQTHSAMFNWRILKII